MFTNSCQSAIERSSAFHLLKSQEADAIVGGQSKNKKIARAAAGLLGAGALIKDFFDNGEDSTLHKAGTWLGETFAKIKIAIWGL